MKNMRITVARLRRVIVVMACLLLVVLAGFFLYARYRFRHFEKDLPGKLGINVERTANGYTVSQASQGHTLYTIHASKLLQYKNGHAQLQDVSITLYGAAGSNRADKIYGQNFDYDQKAQIVHAQGEVQIDLSGLGSDEDKPKTDKSQPAAPEDGQNPQNTIHIKTSDLVFNQKTGEAVTGAHTEFQLPKASGNSMGASYNSKTGLLVLDSQVEIETSNNGKLAVVHAAHAQLLRDSKQAFLLQPIADYQDEKSSSDQAILYFRKDGSAERIESKGHVRVTTESGAVITASNSQTQLDAKSQPERVDMGGGVNFASNDEDSSMHGNAVEGTLTFGPNSMLKHAQFRNAVSFLQQVFHLANDPKGTASRQMQASKVDVDFIPGPDGKKSIAQKALGTGGAQVNLHTIPSKGAQQLTNIRGDQLLATLDPDGQSIRQLDGSGNTKITDLAQDGSTSTSTGDQLHVTFLPQGTKQPTAGKQGSQASQVDTAIQDGHVVITQTPLKKADAKTDPATTKAWASHAEYHSADQMLHLTGDPRLDDGQSLQLSALAIDYHRETGDATARGNVKATYTQAKAGTAPSAAPASPPVAAPGLGGSGPVHITADHAFLHHSTNVSTFYGSESAMARMWQETDSVLAPVLELSQKPQTLKAYGLPGNTAPVVNANLLSASSNKSGSDSAQHQPSVVRVHSQTLFYSDADRRGDFQGTVTAEDPNGVIHSDQAEFYLTPAVKGATDSQQSQLDHIVATGRVTITQPGRKGTGDKLVYTEDDGKYVLTGSAGNLPRVVDATKGTTTGATLIFNSQDDSVVVSGGQSRAVTETRTQKK
jgi:lipopolysaccharide export system protein LptA